MNPTRIALCVLLLFHSISFGILGCGRESASLLEAVEEESALELGELHYEEATQQLVLDLRHEGRARQLRLGGAEGFRAELRDARGKLEYALAIEADARNLRVRQENGAHTLLQLAEIDRGTVSTARSSIDGRWLDTDEREPSAALLRELQNTGLDAAVGDRALLLELLRDERLLTHLTTRTEKMAARFGVESDLASFKRDPDAGELSCALASLASLSCFCLPLPVCWVPCVPSVGTSIACAIAVVVSWVQSWFD